jgi:hypothetical protein
MKIAQLEQGQWVWWFRFNKAATASHPVYETGPERVWYPPIKMPVWLGEYRRAAQNFDDDGLYLIDRTHLIFSYDAFFHTTMPDPDPSLQDHLNDRVAYDGQLFNCDMFLPRGRVGDYFLTVSVDLTAVADSELAEDADNSVFAPYLAPAVYGSGGMAVSDITGGLTSPEPF